MYMFNVLSFLKKKTSHDEDVKAIARRELKEHKDVLESLRDYDAGKKDISTTEIKRRLRNI